MEPHHDEPSFAQGQAILSDSLAAQNPGSEWKFSSNEQRKINFYTALTNTKKCEEAIVEVRRRETDQKSLDLSFAPGNSLFCL